jgi:hypothetical protein
MKHFIAITLLLLAAGCTQGTAVKGKITFEDDGSPLHKGAICFNSPGKSFASGIQKDGSYRSEPLPDGEYKVTITANDLVTIPRSDGKESSDAAIMPIVSGEYDSNRNTPLLFRLESGKPKQWDITVKKSPGYAAIGGKKK